MSKIYASTFKQPPENAGIIKKAARDVFDNTLRAKNLDADTSKLDRAILIVNGRADNADPIIAVQTTGDRGISPLDIIAMDEALTSVTILAVQALVMSGLDRLNASEEDKVFVAATLPDVAKDAVESLGVSKTVLAIKIALRDGMDAIAAFEKAAAERALKSLHEAKAKFEAGESTQDAPTAGPAATTITDPSSDVSDLRSFADRVEKMRAEGMNPAWVLVWDETKQPGGQAQRGVLLNTPNLDDVCEHVRMLESASIVVREACRRCGSGTCGAPDGVTQH